VEPVIVEACLADTSTQRTVSVRRTFLARYRAELPVAVEELCNLCRPDPVEIKISVVMQERAQDRFRPVELGANGSPAMDVEINRLG
jgi:hypothetical protein